MGNQTSNNLAEKIAMLLQTENKHNEDSVRLSLEKINQRLSEIEAKLEVVDSNKLHPSSFILHPSKTHPSQEKYPNLEELADQVIAGAENEKACPYEPTGKPCDHCAMCNSRGF